MNKPIIIDGIDVSECEDLTHQLCCEQYLCEECKGQDCYYKQLQRLKAENKKLKRLINMHLTTFDKCCVNGLIINEVLKDGKIHN